MTLGFTSMLAVNVPADARPAASSPTSLAQSPSVSEAAPEPPARIASFEPGAYAGKNLIVIQCESVQDFMVGLKVDGRTVMPNLTRLSRESWYFTRAYAQVARGNTADSEFAVNTGLYPPAGSAASVRWHDKAVPSLPKLLQDRGYRTFTMHANSANFWNRTQLYEAIGWQRYYDRDDIGWAPHWKWGSPDHVVYHFGVRRMLESRKAGTPFYAQIVSLSAHSPYGATPPKSARPMQVPPKLDGTAVGKYISAQSYADKALGELIAELKRTGLWDESVVVVYGDHYGMAGTHKPEQSAALAKVLGRPYTHEDHLNVPLLVHVPGQAKGHRIDSPIGFVDMLPTLADPLGLDLAGFTTFGRNGFVAGDPLVGHVGGFAAGTFINERIMFEPGAEGADTKVMDLKTRRPTAPDDSDMQDARRIAETIRASLAYADALPVRPGDTRIPADAEVPNGILSSGSASVAY